MDAAVAQPRRWTLSDYERMIDAGIFQPDERVELLDGEIMTMTPQKSLHATVIQLLNRRLDAAFGEEFSVRPQLPLMLPPNSAPEPDIAVVIGSPLDYRDAHPDKALLVVEIADTSLRLDRQKKGPLYAAADIPEFWIVNLVDGIVEVYREPVPMGSGHDYRLVQRVNRQDSITPLAKPDVAIPVKDFLPE